MRSLKPSSWEQFQSINLAKVTGSIMKTDSEGPAHTRAQGRCAGVVPERTGGWLTRTGTESPLGRLSTLVQTPGSSGSSSSKNLYLLGFTWRVAQYAWHIWTSDRNKLEVSLEKIGKIAKFWNRMWKPMPMPPNWRETRQDFIPWSCYLFVTYWDILNS